MKADLPIRKPDKHGSGEWGASRKRNGVRYKHRGIDYAAYPDTPIYPLKPGKVTKIGYLYNDDLSYRYVQITDSEGYDWRYFYLYPLVILNELVDPSVCIGTVQDLGKRYPGITTHCHLGVRKDGKYFNPDDM